MYDMIIIGAGPAGMAAAIYGKRAELNLLVLEKAPMSGGQIVDTYEVDNYPGLPGMNGFDLAMQFREHADKLGMELKSEEVLQIEHSEAGDETHAPRFLVRTAEASYETKTVLLAMGASHAQLGAPGEDRLRGSGVSYCATCDGAFFRGKEVAVVGGGDVAVEDAIFLARGCKQVWLIHRRDELRAAKILQSEVLALPNVTMVWDSVVKSINGENGVTSVTVENVKTKEQRELPVNACFVAVGIAPQSGFVGGLVETDEKGFIRADENGITSVPGIFAAGDLRTKRLRQVITAAADGAVAVTSVTDFLIGKK